MSSGKVTVALRWPDEVCTAYSICREYTARANSCCRSVRSVSVSVYSIDVAHSGLAVREVARAAEEVSIYSMV